MISYLKRYNILICCLLIFFSCSPTISLYDQYAYTQVTSLKVDALNVMDMATGDYSLYEKDIKEVQLKINKAIEYDKHRFHNEITNKMWQVLTDTTGHLYGGFIVRWKQKRKLDRVYLEDKKKQISYSFDQIAELESKKIKPSQASN